MPPFSSYTFPVETVARKSNGILNHRVSATFPNCGNTFFHPVKIEARKPGIVFIDKKERVVIITDLAIPGDDRVKGKELEKLEKYQLLKDEIAKVWRMRKVIVVHVVIRAL